MPVRIYPRSLTDFLVLATTSTGRLLTGRRRDRQASAAATTLAGDGGVSPVRIA
ncbi:hypothetical protein [Nocardioides campestrisoli]|uniref:hypothetical protein n=1 Tax=Nocardioides campestrisoli TaxID=2736757 RepID=UPI00163DE403|nr:hypothetical protein [Nocardioides campestrisoli]